MKIDAYSILNVSQNASLKEIKISYRELVKKHHPDKGGDERIIIQLNAAWEILKDKQKRKLYDEEIISYLSTSDDFHSRNLSKYKKEDITKSDQSNSSEIDSLIKIWIKQIYLPIDRLISEIINPFSIAIKDLSADPYDEDLMKNFCNYIEKSQKKMLKIHNIYQSKETPNSIKKFSLDLYHCFSEVEDALYEFEIYTQGYVDNYLHDGQEMLRQAKKNA